MHDRSRASIRIAAAAAISLSVLAGTAVGAAATEFPKGWEGYHSYTEMTAEVAAVAAAHPDIVHLFSIGQSYKGRELWAVKVCDNVNVDENEPEVLFDGTHHSDEHMGVEMTLHIIHWLVDGYGVDPRITNIVDTREIWIVFLVNPDGAEYDISGGKYHFWRKNRQPSPGSTRDRHRPEPELRLPLGPAAVGPARTRGRSRTTGRGRSPRPRRGRCATSWPAASSTAVSRSGPRSRSTSPAGWSCGRTATR